MAAKWYVLHVYSGFENKVAQSIREQAEQHAMTDKIQEVLVPMEEVVEVRRGAKVNAERKFFPGYVLVELESPLGDETLQMIKETPKVTGFVGGGTVPTPLTNEEVESLLKQVDAGQAEPREQVKFIKSDNVRIIDGPFLGFNGVVDEVDQDHSRLKVMVSIFGRSTPVELGFLQVERI